MLSEGTENIQQNNDMGCHKFVMKMISSLLNFPSKFNSCEAMEAEWIQDSKSKLSTYIYIYWCTKGVLMLIDEDLIPFET